MALAFHAPPRALAGRPAAPSRSAGGRAAAARRVAAAAALPPPPRTAADVMTPAASVASVSPDDPIDAALEVLATRGVSGLPVVEGGAPGGAVVGVLSSYDLLVFSASDPGAAGGLGFPAPEADWAGFFAARAAAAKRAGATVRNVMTSPAVTVRADAPLSAVADALLSARVGRLPVVDAAGALVGVVTRGDVVRAAWRARGGGGA
jgi:CBS domain-containing protein